MFAQMFTRANFEIVTAGHVYDINFLVRLKSIIELADYVVTNDVVGTCLGYCVYMKKPCFIIHDIIDDSYSRIDYYRGQPDYKEIDAAFSVCHDSFTVDQYAIVSKYWRFNLIKSKEELHILLS